MGSAELQVRFFFGAGRIHQVQMAQANVGLEPLRGPSETGGFRPRVAAVAPPGASGDTA